MGICYTVGKYSVTSAGPTLNDEISISLLIKTKAVFLKVLDKMRKSLNFILKDSTENI